jgi:hypothetical protein
MQASSAPRFPAPSSPENHADFAAWSVRSARELPGTDDPCGFARDVKARQSLQGKIPVPDPIVCLMRFPVQRKNQCQCMFSHRCRRVGRHAHHFHAGLLRSQYVDIVETATAERDVTVSPDGSRLAFISDRPGDDEDDRGGDELKWGRTAVSALAPAGELGGQ